MKMKFFPATIASLAILTMAVPALAHCRDARKTCEFTALCMRSNGARQQVIREGAHMNNAAGGNKIWSELASCAIARVEWSASGEGNRSFDDIASGCAVGDYLAAGKAGVQFFDGASGACNQF